MEQWPPKGRGGEWVRSSALGGRPGETHHRRGQAGGKAAGFPARMGREPCAKLFSSAPPARIAVSVRVSKAAPGLFRSGNLILRRVYFSTSENSQCRTGPAPPSLSTRLHPSKAAGSVGAAGCAGPSRSNLGGAPPVSFRVAPCGNLTPHRAGWGGGMEGRPGEPALSVHTPDIAA